MAYGEIIFWSLIFFLAGVGLGGSSWSISLIILAALVLAALLFFWKSLSIRWLIFLVGLTFFGAFYFHLYGVLINRTISLPQEKTTFQAVVTELPRRYDNLTVVSMKALPPWSGTFDLLVNLPLDVQYGEKLEITGSFEDSNWPDMPSLWAEDVERFDGDNTRSLRSILVNIREKLIHGVYQILPSDHAAFIAGITVGARGGMSTELREAMRASGTTHLVVLSGYNVLIVVLIARRLLEKRLAHKKRFYVISLALFLFLMLVAVEPSITRAGIMGWLVLLGEYWGRLVHFGYLIVLAGAVMLLIYPSLLVYSIGFQLSFLSLIGIAYVAPILKRFMSEYLKEKTNTPLVEALCETAAAQLMVWPLLSFYFDGVSLTSLVANMLILPLVPFLMVAGIFLSLAAAFNIHLGALFSFVIKPLVDYVLSVIHIFSWLTIPLPDINQPLIIISIYGILALVLVPRVIDNKR